MDGIGRTVVRENSADLTAVREQEKVKSDRRKEVRQNRRNVLIMIHALYGGGSERVACNLASALAETCHVTIVYCNETEQTYPLDPRCETVKMPWRSGSRWGIPGKCAAYLERIRFVRRLKKKRNIDVSVSFLIQMSMINVLSRYREKVVTSERANPRKYQPQWFNRTRFIYAVSDYVIFQSEQVRSLYGKRIQSHSSVIANPVFVNCPADSLRGHRVVTMGRLAEQKNHAMLIRSFTAFHRLFPEYTLSIYGEGSLFDELEGLIRKEKVESSVFLEGNHEDVHEKIRDAEMFVLSSDFEGLSNALLECFSMGIACISTRCEGSTDVIRDGENGLLVDIGDEKGLTEALCLLAGDPSYRKKLEKQAVADSVRYAPKNIMEKWEAVLFDVPVNKE